MTERMGKTYLIYALVDPRYENVRYVGMTTTTLQTRLKGHLRDVLRYPALHRSLWIKELLGLSLQPIPVLLETTTASEWSSAECKWIDYFGRPPLTNMTAGGDGRVGVPHSEEARQKMRQALVGRPVSTTTRELLSRKMIERGSPPQERRDRISATLTGRTQKQENVDARRRSWHENGNGKKHLDQLNSSLTADERKAKAARTQETLKKLGKDLGSAERYPCPRCDRLLRKIDMPRHKCVIN